jgi:hypothetical protein
MNSIGQIRNDAGQERDEIRRSNTGRSTSALELPSEAATRANFQVRSSLPLPT